MFPVTYYTELQSNRHARLGRLARRARRHGRLRAGEAPAGTVTVRAPEGRVVLTAEGVTRLDDSMELARR